jgi:pteridine reductase
MLKTLQGRTALITGASRRIGRETALALAEQGVNIALHFNRSEGEAQQLAAELERKGVKAWTVRADFRQPQEYQSLVERARSEAGALDILVNNASMFPAEAIGDLTWSGFSADMEVNAWVPLTLSRNFAEGLTSGSIITLHDTHLQGFDFKHAGYILSKHVLAELTRMMALEFAPDITVNAVAPGLILPPPGADESYLVSHARGLPLQKHGAPRDIAEAIVFLLRSDFITGQVIYVDGGRHLGEYGTHGPISAR